MMKSKSSILVACCILHCGLLLSAQAIAQDDSNAAAKAKIAAVEKAELGSAKNVHRAGNLFFAGQFSADDLNVIKENQFERVITLRTDGEIDWDEEKAIKQAGLDFIKVPFRSLDSLTDKVFDQTRELLRDKANKTLFHCGSANRVGGVWLPYRVLDEGVDLEKAIKEAEAIGLRTPFIKQKAIQYIKRKQAEDAAKPSDNKASVDSDSVRPGINARFLSPDLDPLDFVKRFEVESREIYVSRKEIVDTCQVRTGEVVADVGAGTGLFTRLFADRVGDSGWVYSIDISPRFVEHVNREAVEAARGNITTVLCTETSVCLPPNSVDVVFVCDTYHHFEYPKATLASIYSALKKDGRLIVIDFERIAGVSRDFVMGHVRAGKEVFRAEIQDAGFALRAEERVDGLRENYFLAFGKSNS